MIVMDEYFIEEVEDKFVVKKWVDKDKTKVEVVKAFESYLDAITFLRHISEARLESVKREARNENL